MMIFIFAIGASFASEDADMQANNGEISTDLGSLSETQNVDNDFSAGDMESQADKQTLGAAEDGADVLSDSGSFNQLNTLIYYAASGSTVNLDKNYTRTSSSDASSITISKALTIDGHGFTINGTKLSSTRIFYVTTSSKVIFKNIIPILVLMQLVELFIVSIRFQILNLQM